jgi:hypothetical protein
MYPGLRADEQAIVIEAVRRAVERFGGLDVPGAGAAEPRSRSEAAPASRPTGPGGSPADRSVSSPR